MVVPLRPPDNSEDVRAGIYCRLSLAVMGDATKVDEQELLCRDLAGRLGWEVVDVYSDNSRTAWRRNKRRPQWERMLGDVESGRITAIINYHGDRLVRQPRDLEKLIDLAEGKGIRLASPTGTRNPDNRDDRVMLRVIAAFAEAESAAISDRRKMQYERWRRAGRVRAGGRGGRTFGYDTDGLSLFPPCRCDVATREERSEAEIIREMAARVLAGESSSGIARDLTARGWRTPSGTVITQTFVRRLLARPRYVGLMPDGESAAAWPAILDRETWERVCIALDKRAVMNPAPTSRRRWLLSGIAVCGPCGRQVQIGMSSHDGHGHSYPSYSCVKGCTRRDATHLDTYVAARTVRLLNDPRQPEGELPVPPDHAPEWLALTAERAEVERIAKNYASSPGRLTLLMARLDSIDARMAELREREAGDARSRLLGRYRGITAARFADLPLDVRRALVAASFRVTVLPASGRGPGFRTEDVRLDPPG
jgi:site-specific DNA recombinase